MSSYATMAQQDRSNYNQWYGNVQNWANQAMGSVPEWSTRFTNPTDFAKQVSNNMMYSTDAYQTLTPGYRDFLTQTAPRAYAQQQLESMAGKPYGRPAENNFPQYYAQWLGQGAGGNQGQYGYGAPSTEKARSTWDQFVINYDQMLRGDTNQQYMSNLTPQELQSFHELALSSAFSPFGQNLLGRYLDEAYNYWSNFTKATPWTQFLQAINPADQGPALHWYDQNGNDLGVRHYPDAGWGIL